MKFYLYVSRSKAEMLFNQVPGHRSGKGTMEWKLGIPGAVSITRSLKDGESPLDDQTMLTAVTAELEASGLVGTIEEPNEYIKGIMLMRWGVFDDFGERPTGDLPLVYFGGFDKDNSILLGLGGSSKHLVGSQGITNTHSRSNTPSLARALLRGLEYPNPELPEWWDLEDEEDRIFSAMAIAQHNFRPPSQLLEFFVLVQWTAQNTL